MTDKELRERIAALRTSANGLAEPEKTNKLDDADSLEMQIEGMGLDRAAAIMSGTKTADIADLDAKITAAQDATKAEQERIKIITGAIGKIKGFLGLP